MSTLVLNEKTAELMLQDKCSLPLLAWSETMLLLLLQKRRVQRKQHPACRRLLSA